MYRNYITKFLDLQVFQIGGPFFCCRSVKHRQHLGRCSEHMRVSMERWRFAEQILPDLDTLPIDKYTFYWWILS